MFRRVFKQLKGKNDMKWHFHTRYYPLIHKVAKLTANHCNGYRTSRLAVFSFKIDAIMFIYIGFMRARKQRKCMCTINTPQIVQLDLRGWQCMHSRIDGNIIIPFRGPYLFSFVKKDFDFIFFHLQIHFLSSALSMNFERLKSMGLFMPHVN